MNGLETRTAIQKALTCFTAKPLADAAIALFEALGYKSKKRMVLNPNTATTFTEAFAKDKPLNAQEQVHEKTDLELVTWLVIKAP